MVFGLVSIAYLECQKLFGLQEEEQQEDEDRDVIVDVSVDVRCDVNEESGDGDQFKSLENSIDFLSDFEFFDAVENNVTSDSNADNEGRRSNTDSRLSSKTPEVYYDCLQFFNDVVEDSDSVHVNFEVKQTLKETVDSVASVFKVKNLLVGTVVEELRKENHPAQNQLIHKADFELISNVCRDFYYVQERLDQIVQDVSDTLDFCDFGETKSDLSLPVDSVESLSESEFESCSSETESEFENGSSKLESEYSSSFDETEYIQSDFDSELDHQSSFDHLDVPSNIDSFPILDYIQNQNSFEEEPPTQDTTLGDESPETDTFDKGQTPSLDSNQNVKQQELSTTDVEENNRNSNQEVSTVENTLDQEVTSNSDQEDFDQNSNEEFSSEENTLDTLVISEDEEANEDSGFSDSQSLIEDSPNDDKEDSITNTVELIDSIRHYIWDLNRFITYPDNSQLPEKEYTILSDLFVSYQDNQKSKMALPRELMLIIDDIAQQNCHLLEWEVFGNASEDMRVVLTWRKLDRNNPKRNGRWKLRQSSITKLDDDDSLENLDFLDVGSRKDSKGESWESRQRGDSRSGGGRQPYDEGEYRGRGKGDADRDDQDAARRKRSSRDEEARKDRSGSKTGAEDDDAAARRKRDPYDEGDYKGRSKDGSNDPSSKREGSSIRDESDESAGRKKRDPYDEGDYKGRGKNGSDDPSSKREGATNQDGSGGSEDAAGRKKRDPYDEGDYKGRSKDGLDDTSNKERLGSNQEGASDAEDAGRRKRDPYEEGEYKKSSADKEKNEEAEKDEDESASKKKKKNPFRKATKDEKLKMKRNQLQLSFSVDEDVSSISDLGSTTGDDEGDGLGGGKRKARSPYDEGEYKEKSLLDNETIQESEENKGANGLTGKGIAILEDEDHAGRKRRGAYDEGEYKEPGQQGEGEDGEGGDGKYKLGKGRDISQLDDPDDPMNRRKRGAYDEGDYKERNKEPIPEIEPAEMKDFDPSRRSKFDDQLSEASLDVSIEERLAEVETIEDINTRKEAMKVLEIKRHRLSIDVDNAQDPLLNGVINSLTNGHSEEHKLGARELRESNMLSLAVDTGTYGEDDAPMQKKFELPKIAIKDKIIEEPDINKHGSVARLKPTMYSDSVTGWERCVDCKYNSFCDDLVHKSEYMAILLNDRENDTVDTEDCKCNVCNGGAVHNGCVYRELLRLKTEYRLFDKRNLCLCSTCIPFKYRKVCLRQELRNLRREGVDLYYRLTYHGDDGKEGYHPNINDYYVESDEEEETENHPFSGVSFKNVLCLDDVDMELTNEDKINFRNCVDCSFNGFCDDLRHKKLFKLLLRLDVEEFDDLDDDCSCLVCEFKGSAHSGCARREIIRLKYDFLLYDKRNLCYCPQCIPFRYRSMCLRQEMKLLRRRKNVDLYCNL
ncbi:dentin sialophosphoprotein-like [Clytia hemisphaerica]|uniref:Uncharacterized protein n=1 Tax=Clytia hemisphaerica TaxID=252671 RepID=A0A7M5VE28_9CNID